MKVLFIILKGLFYKIVDGIDLFQLKLIFF